MNLPGFERQKGFLEADPDLTGGIEFVMTDPEVKIPPSKLVAMVREVSEDQYGELLDDGKHRRSVLVVRKS